MQRRELYKKIIEDNTQGKDEMREIILERVKRSGIKIKPRRKIAVIAIVISVIMLMGVSAGYILNTQWVFDEYGNRTAQRFWMRQRPNPLLSMSDEDRERWAWENAYFWNWDGEWKDNILRVVFQDMYSSAGERIDRRIYDYCEFLEFMQDVRDIFKMPQYIPDGYAFAHAYIQFYLCENFDFSMAELIMREEKFGNIYEKWYVPENRDNIKRLTIAYEKGESSDFNRFYYDAELWSGGIESTTFSGHQNTVAEILNLPQFERDILMSTGGLDGTESWTHQVFHGMNTLPEYINTQFVSPRGGNNLMRRQDAYRTVMYTINSNFLTHEQIIRMAESIR